MRSEISLFLNQLYHEFLSIIIINFIILVNLSQLHRVNLHLYLLLYHSIDMSINFHSLQLIIQTAPLLMCFYGGVAMSKGAF
jgi:hypothetical protein